MVFAGGYGSSPDKFLPSRETPNPGQTNTELQSCYKRSEINNANTMTTYVVNEQNNPNNIVDKNLNTVWIKNFGYPASLTIELEKLTNICRIDVAWTDTLVTTFSISASDDGIFKPISSYKDNHLDKTLFKPYIIPDFNTKYIKLSFSSDTDVKIREVKIFNH
jgi:hypothetical protein